MTTLGVSNRNVQQPTRSNGRNSTSSAGYAGDRATLSQSSTAFGNGGWNSNIWARSALPSLSSTIAEPAHPRAATAASDAINGSRSLLPNSQLESWAGQSLAWNCSPSSSSHASSVNQGGNTPPGHSASVNPVQHSRGEAFTYLAAAQSSTPNLVTGPRGQNWGHYNSSSATTSASNTAFDNGIGRSSHHNGIGHITNGASGHSPHNGSLSTANGLQESSVNPFDNANPLPFRPNDQTASFFSSASSMNLASMTPSSSQFSTGTPRHSISTGHGRPSLAEDELAAALSRIDLSVVGALADHRQQSLPPRPPFQQRSSYDTILPRTNTIDLDDSHNPYPQYARDISSPSVNLPTLIRRQEQAQRSLDNQRNSLSAYLPSSESQFQESAVHGVYSPRYRYFSSDRNHSPDEQAELLAQGLRAIQQQQQQQQHEQNYSAVPLNQIQPGIHLPPSYRYTAFQPVQHNGMHQVSLPVYQMNGFPPISPTVAHPPSAPEHDPSQVARSPVLQEFRANNKGNKRYELKDIYGHIVEFCGDQHGSRFIQLKLETANSDEKDRVFQEIRPNAVQLMMDLFGNYVIQKLFEHGNQQQKRLLATQMQGHIGSLSVQTYGCRTVQKALEHVLVDQQAAMVKELEDCVMKCVTNQNGNHVIQKAIERIPNEHIRFIIDEFRGQIPRYATHTYGCRVIQRMLEYCPLADRLSILSEIHNCTNTLISDQYGNYVIQHIIEFGEEVDKTRIIGIVIENAVYFSKHKFASNVVEKSITFGSLEQRLGITRILSAVNEKGEGPLLGLMRDQYGNYVIQKSLSVLEGEDYQMLVDRITPLMPLLKKCSYGKQIAGIESHLHKNGLPSSSSSSASVELNRPLGLNVHNHANSLTYTRDNSPVYDLSPVTADRSSIPSANTSVLEDSPLDLVKEEDSSTPKAAIP